MQQPLRDRFIEDMRLAGLSARTQEAYVHAVASLVAWTGTPPRKITEDDVIAWLRSPVVIAVEVAFLVFVTYHALLGVRAILFDFGFSERTERRITNIFWVIGIVTIVYGIVLFAAILNAAP